MSQKDRNNNKKYFEKRGKKKNLGQKRPKTDKINGQKTNGLFWDKKDHFETKKDQKKTEEERKKYDFETKDIWKKIKIKKRGKKRVWDKKKGLKKERKKKDTDISRG